MTLHAPSRFLLVAALFLAACPVSPEAGGPSPGGAPPPAEMTPGQPPGEGQPPGPPPGDGAPVDGQAAPVGATAAPGDPSAAPPPPLGAEAPDPSKPPPEGAPTELQAPMKPAGFASLIGSGPSVTISGTVKGLKKGQVDFTAAKGSGGAASPEVLDTVEITDGTFSVKVPATYDRPIYVSVRESSGPSVGLSGGTATPIKLSGKDVAVEITVSKELTWTEGLPWSHKGGPAARVPLAPAAGAAPTPG